MKYLSIFDEAQKRAHRMLDPDVGLVVDWRLWAPMLVGLLEPSGAYRGCYELSQIMGVLIVPSEQAVHIQCWGVLPPLLDFEYFQSDACFRKHPFYFLIPAGSKVVPMDDEVSATQQGLFQIETPYIPASVGKDFFYMPTHAARDYPPLDLSPKKDFEGRYSALFEPSAILRTH